MVGIARKLNEKLDVGVKPKCHDYECKQFYNKHLSSYQLSPSRKSQRRASI